ncbi:MAG: 4'-phosphopantetheinyl transferase family protein [Bacteroidales bacterium]
MPIHLKHSSKNESWAVWKIEESESDLCGMLSERECHLSVEHIKSPARRLEYLAVRLLCADLIGSGFAIDYCEDGSPRLKSEGEYQFISISHTKGYAAVYLHTSHPVGIDIEQYGEKVLRIRSKFINEEEDKSLDPKELVSHLLIHWSAKESLFKAMGQTGVDFRQHLHIHPFVPLSDGCFEAHETRTPQANHYSIHYRVESDFVLTRAILLVPNLP